MTTEKVQLNSDLEVAHPCSGSSFTIPGRIGIWNLKIIMLSFEERGKPKYPEKKLLGAKERTNHKLNPHVASTPGFEPGPHWWEATALTTATPLLSPRVVYVHKVEPPLTATFTQWPPLYNGYPFFGGQSIH